MESNSRRVQQQQPDDLTNIEFESSEDVKVIPTFESMGLRDDLLRGIYAYGFEKPSAIQQRAIALSSRAEMLLLRPNRVQEKRQHFLYQPFRASISKLERHRSWF